MPKINVTKSSLPPFEEYIEEIRDIWQTHWLTNMGAKHDLLEQELKSYLKVNNLSLFTNGHLALEMAIQALNIPYGSEIITTPYTFASTTHAIVRNNCVPVFCDIEPNSCTIDADKIEELITDKTEAILPVHVYGNVCDIEKIEKIALKYNLKVIYDAAHVFGVEYKGEGVGVFGDMSMFSMHATKVFNTIEGGAISCGNTKYIEILYNLKNFGIQGQESVVAVGGNGKMNEFQAAMGLCNLKNLNKQIEKRKDIVHRYKKHLQDIQGIEFLLVEDKNVKSNYAYFPILCNKEVLGVDRNHIFEELKKHNINTRKYFYPLATEFECYKNKFGKNETPIAKYISENVLVLPLYWDLSMGDVDMICNAILQILNIESR